jgi:hypothetical protein
MRRKMGLKRLREGFGIKIIIKKID